MRSFLAIEMEISKMPIAMQNRAAVLIANDVNLSIFKAHWLIDNGVIRREEVCDQLVVSPALVQIMTRDFELAVFPNRIQQAFRPNAEDVSGTLGRVMGRIVTLLPHTPYVALGLNFGYLIRPEDINSFNSWTRQQFAAPFASEALRPDDAGARFGAYFSCDTLGFRLKVTCTPTQIEAVTADVSEFEVGQYAVVMDLNFHTPIPPMGIPTILERLNSWDLVASYAGELAGRLCNTAKVHQ